MPTKPELESYIKGLQEEMSDIKKALNLSQEGTYSEHIIEGIEEKDQIIKELRLTIGDMAVADTEVSRTLVDKNATIIALRRIRDEYKATLKLFNINPTWDYPMNGIMQMDDVSKRKLATKLDAIGRLNLIDKITSGDVSGAIQDIVKGRS